MYNIGMSDEEILEYINGAHIALQNTIDDLCLAVEVALANELEYIAEALCAFFEALRDFYNTVASEEPQFNYPPFPECTPCDQFN